MAYGVTNVALSKQQLFPQPVKLCPSGGWMLLPDDLNAVGGKLGVGGEDVEVLFQRLRNEHTVEWVAVVRRKLLGTQDVRAANGEQCNSLRVHLDHEVLDGRSCRDQPAFADLDGEFPEGDGADHQLVRVFTQNLVNAAGKRLRFADPPDQDVGVEKVFQMSPFEVSGASSIRLAISSSMASNFRAQSGGN